MLRLFAISGAFSLSDLIVVLITVPGLFTEKGVDMVCHEKGLIILCLDVFPFNSFMIFGKYTLKTE